MSFETEFTALVDHVCRRVPIANSRWHGQTHWRRVEANGLLIAGEEAVDVEVIRCFAWLHDCQRENEDHDPQHGPRAARFAKRRRHRIPLTNAQFAQLWRACAGHTFGERHIDPTVAACWDADRLDLWRVHVEPDPRRMLTRTGQQLARTRGWTRFGDDHD